MILQAVGKKMATHAAFYIFLLGLFLRLAVGCITFAHTNFDTNQFIHRVKADGYYEIASNLYEHHVFSQDQTTLIPDSTRTPGYPALIVASLFLTHSIWFVLGVQILIASYLPILVGKLAHMLTLPDRLRYGAMIFLAIDPFSISLSIRFFTEIFFTLLLLSAVIQLVRFIQSSEQNFRSTPSFRSLYFAGVLLGCATLFRPSTMYLSTLLAIAWLGYRLIRKQTAFTLYMGLFLVCSVLPVFPWMIRNYVEFKTFSYSAIKEQVLYETLAPSLLVIKNHQPFTVAQQEYLAADGITGTPSLSVDKAPWFRQRAIETIKQYPREFIIVAAISVTTFFTHDGLLDLLSLWDIQRPEIAASEIVRFFHLTPEARNALLATLFQPAMIALVLDRCVWTVVGVLFVVTTLHCLIRRRLSVTRVLFILIIAYFSLTTISNGLSINARFRFPVNGLVLLVVCEGYICCQKKSSNNELKNQKPLEKIA